MRFFRTELKFRLPHHVAIGFFNKVCCCYNTNAQAKTWTKISNFPNGISAAMLVRCEFFTIIYFFFDGLVHYVSILCAQRGSWSSDWNTNQTMTDIINLKTWLSWHKIAATFVCFAIRYIFLFLSTRIAKQRASASKRFKPTSYDHEFAIVVAVAVRDGVFFFFFFISLHSFHFCICSFWVWIECDAMKDSYWQRPGKRKTEM